MKASVIIPVYNGKKFIAQTIQSALDQTLQGHEVIVVNDGSTDNSEKEILKFRDRVVYIKQENKGVSAARNIGIQRAKSEYIAFLDQDDIFMPNKLKKLASFLDQHPGYGMVYSQISRIDGDGNLLAAKKIPTHSGDIFPQLFMKCYIAPSMAMCRKQMLLDAGLFQERFSSEGEDYDIFLRLARAAPVGVVQEELVMYRVHMENVSKKGQDLAPFRGEEILSQYKDYLIENYRMGWWYYRKRMSKIYREQAKVYLSQGRVSDGRKCLKRSLGLYPFRFEVIMKYLGLISRG